MRSFIVAAMLALALSTAFALDICPGGNLGSSSLTVIDTRVPGEEYTAVGCNVRGKVRLNGDGPPSNSSAPILITVEDSAIYGTLEIHLPYPQNALTNAPFYVTIQNNVFQNDTRIGFYLNLPPHSWITFQGNQMSGNATQYWPESVVAITVEVNFYENTTFNIINNTISFNKDEPNGSYYHILFSSSTTEGSSNVTLNILRNTLTTKGTSYVEMIRISSWSTEDNFTVRIESNTLTATDISYDARAISLVRSFSSISISSNVLELSNGNNGVSAIYFSYLRTDSLRIDQNTITTNAPYFIQGSVEPRYANISGNTFTSTRDSITAPVISVDNYNFINATLVVASNTVTAPTVTTTNTPLLGITNLSISGTASIIHCGNSLPWAATAEQLFSPSVSDILVFDSVACIIPTTITTSTTSTSALATTTMVDTSTTPTTQSIPATSVTTTDIAATSKATTTTAAITTTQSIPASSSSNLLSITSAAVVCLLFAIADLF